jgi:hypothetical protein
VVRADTTERARQTLAAEAQKAASVLIDNMLDDDPRVRNKASNDVLDRIGICRVNRTDVDVKTSVLVLDADMAKQINKSFELDQD